MPPSFAFIPRNLAKRHPPAVGTQPPPQRAASAKGKERAVDPHPSAEECAILFSLALSEYAIWSDPDLRMKLSQEPNYVSLHYLLQHSDVLLALRDIPQTLLVKNLKTYLSETLQFRMLVEAPEPWFNPGRTPSSQSAGGGYEVCLKGWDPATAPLLSKSDWEKRTIYVENVPIHYRNISALAKFLVALLPTAEPQTAIDSISRIQHIFVPSHHRDKPGTAPTFKGFALITFLHELDAQKLIESWPWQPPAEGSCNTSVSSEKEITKDAVRFGFRSTSKSTWEALRAEYLLYKQQLIQDINAHQDASAPTEKYTASRHSEGPQTAALAEMETPPTTPAIAVSSPYPYGCLVFVKNVHIETNKTTLKNMFGKALAQSNSAVMGGIDYVDFNKGMDTCYLRLSTPECAHFLASHFRGNPTVQTKGLDDIGSSGPPPESDLKPMIVDLVVGTRENVYWHKVPEKIRYGAVEKALQLRDRGVQVGDLQQEIRPKKRRKR